MGPALPRRPRERRYPHAPSPDGRGRICPPEMLEDHHRRRRRRGAPSSSSRSSRNRANPILVDGFVRGARGSGSQRVTPALGPFRDGPSVRSVGDSPLRHNRIPPGGTKQGSDPHPQGGRRRNALDMQEPWNATAPVGRAGEAASASVRTRCPRGESQVRSRCARSVIDGPIPRWAVGRRGRRILMQVSVVDEAVSRWAGAGDRGDGRGFAISRRGSKPPPLPGPQGLPRASHLPASPRSPRVGGAALPEISRSIPQPPSVAVAASDATSRWTKRDNFPFSSVVRLPVRAELGLLPSRARGASPDSGSWCQRRPPSSAVHFPRGRR